MKNTIMRCGPGYPSTPPAPRSTIICLVVAAGAWVSIGCMSSVVPPATSPPPLVPPTSLPATQPLEATSVPIATATPTSSLPFDLADGDLGLSAVSYRIPLTIRHVTQTQASVFFELDEPASGMVYLVPRRADVRVQSLNLSTADTENRLTFDQLEPGTEYEVVVALNDGGDHFLQPSFRGRAWGPVVLRTFPTEGSTRFAAISDASFGDPTTRVLIEEMAASQVDFVVHAGDVVDQTQEGVDPFDSYAEKYYDVFEPVLRSVPVYTVPGNHDYDMDVRAGDEPFYYRAFPAFPDASFPGQEAAEQNQFYGFEHAGVRFLMLDSQVLFGVAGRDAETQWLEARLAETGYRATIVVVHVAPFSSSSVHPTDSLPIRAAWVPLFEQAEVALVISGHFHQYERLEVNGIPYIVTGGGSSTLYAPGAILPQSLMFKRQSHFLLGEIDGDKLTLTAVGVDGQAIDQLAIQLN